MTRTNLDSRIDYEPSGERRNAGGGTAYCRPCRQPDNKVIRPAGTEGPLGGYGTHSVLRYSVILWVEHGTALLKEIEVGFYLPSHRSVIVAAALGTHYGRLATIC